MIATMFGLLSIFFMTQAFILYWNYKKGDEIKLNIGEGKIYVGGKEFSFPVLPKEIIEIRNAGGLLAYTRKKLKNRTKP